MKLPAAHFLRTGKFSGLFALVLATLPIASYASVTWTELHSPTRFSARAGFATAYDPIGKKVVLFGGTDEAGNQLNDTWTFDGTSWTQVVTAVTPGTRGDAGVAYDAKSRKLVMFGGFRGFVFLNETWLWDGASETWTQAEPVTIPRVLPIRFCSPIRSTATSTCSAGIKGSFSRVACTNGPGRTGNS